MDTIYASAKLRVPGGVKLVLEKEADHHMFGTDSMRLLQLINNLVNNAIKNTKEGSITMGYTIQPDDPKLPDMLRKKSEIGKTSISKRKTISLR